MYKPLRKSVDSMPDTAKDEHDLSDDPDGAGQVWRPSVRVQAPGRATLSRIFCVMLSTFSLLSILILLVLYFIFLGPAHGVSLSKLTPFAPSHMICTAHLA